MDCSLDLVSCFNKIWYKRKSLLLITDKFSFIFDRQFGFHFRKNKLNIQVNANLSFVLAEYGPQDTLINFKQIIKRTMIVLNIWARLFKSQLMLTQD